MKCKEEEHVIFIPGAGMFLDMENNKNYVRMSYTACRLEDMEEGVRRMGPFLCAQYPRGASKGLNKNRTGISLANPRVWAGLNFILPRRALRAALRLQAPPRRLL